MANKLQVTFLAIGLIITGCLNSVFTKYQDNQDVSPGKKFEQPVLQTLQMFIGEAAAFIFWGLDIVQRKKNGYQELEDQQLINSKPNLPLWKSYLLAIPAICDIVGTTLMMVGLAYVPVSIYQMTRGALILFVAIFSIIFLKRSISRIEWLSLFTVVLGIAIVGISGNSNSGSSAESSSTTEPLLNPRLLLGIAMILTAQVFVATQFVFEEHIISKWSIEPLKMVGFEGTFGSIIVFLVMFFGDITVGHDTKGPLDLQNAFYELFSSKKIIYSSFAIMLSILFFNSIGIMLTSKLSATARSTIDTCRTLLVWVVSIYLGWESFVFLQFIGFVLLVLGTLVFNGALIIDNYLPRWFSDDKNKPLIIDSIDEQIERI
ncbi:putative membrane protein [Wickerhamomyces ciferrii]|uniref:Membrane protein n=1 Tax=Wickerhamomyces ciferrii (strain ATCC 14091 / BCRC 22168 / CBS 111 / JCM 3599 / NBRC 0793 / NRRL Y-1031 F-60-10) TaxID=1206466 RepID=K0KSY6_WICCF|nr:uncharacterized protein BN7_4007 [Wickerhamomyces ciferrii]CCH44443.1 putative membrane protein [Wickerhamomyces ciferrii]